jgi:hypothetical protein
MTPRAQARAKAERPAGKGRRKRPREVADKRPDEQKVDTAVEATFPASDPAVPGHTTATEAPSRPVDRQAPVITSEEIERARGARPAAPQAGAPDWRQRAPGDDALPGTPATGEDVCPRCKGQGRVEGRPCPLCEGVGTLTKGIGGA